MFGSVCYRGCGRAVIPVDEGAELGVPAAATPITHRQWPHAEPWPASVSMGRLPEQPGVAANSRRALAHLARESSRAARAQALARQASRGNRHRDTDAADLSGAGSGPRAALPLPPSF
jgi:hypothetical protein